MFSFRYTSGVCKQVIIQDGLKSKIQTLVDIFTNY